MTTEMHAPRELEGLAVRAWRGVAGRVEQFAGIVRTPAAGDYSDARYFVDRAIAGPGSNAAVLLAAQAESIPGLKQTVTATNLAEMADGTHLLTAGTIVQVFALEARTSPGIKVYFFDLSPVLAVVVSVTSEAEGDGEYNGRVLAGVASAAGASALVMPSGMNPPTVDDALILNAEETGLSGHRLATGAYAVGVVRGLTNESPPRRIVVIRGAAGRTDSPTTLGGTSSSETADVATWSKAADGTPVTVWVTARVVYNSAGDQTLYAFARALGFDARGVLSSISAETRITVDVTEACE